MENPYTELIKGYYADVHDGRITQSDDPTRLARLKEKQAEWNALKTEIAQSDPNDPHAAGTLTSALLRSLFGAPKYSSGGRKSSKSKRTRRR